MRISLAFWRAYRVLFDTTGLEQTRIYGERERESEREVSESRVGYSPLPAKLMLIKFLSKLDNNTEYLVQIFQVLLTNCVYRILAQDLYNFRKTQFQQIHPDLTRHYAIMLQGAPVYMHDLHI